MRPFNLRKSPEHEIGLDFQDSLEKNDLKMKDTPRDITRKYFLLITLFNIRCNYAKIIGIYHEKSSISLSNN